MEGRDRRAELPLVNGSGRMTTPLFHWNHPRSLPDGRCALRFTPCPASTQVQFEIRQVAHVHPLAVPTKNVEHPQQAPSTDRL
ncbi:MAG: hypothetical protein ACI835_005534 [Planctomycetota bacterium]